ncbi:C40 family peptidase [Nonomuraea harbinensis]|uniref:C40 family peptidase n=1 Tax=Nonomuraea harbinensis TaxID=1286938 RepID=A0ABW1BM57_9ACTN|nr:NlpC/P60 family protein [Nonomuraea harbinensis]
MIVESGLTKVLVMGGALVSGVVVISGASGGAQYASTYANTVCSYAFVPATLPEAAASWGASRLSSAQLAHAKGIVDAARALRLPRRAAEIAIAIALQESGLDNSAVGDPGKAFGLFQQRPDSGWGTRAQVSTPDYAARAFYKRLIKVPGWETMPLTKAAAIVQRPRQDLRGEYAKHERKARTLTATLWKPTRVAASPGTSHVRLSASEKAELRQAIQTAAALGTPRSSAIDDVASALAEQTGRDDQTEIRRHAEKAITAIAGDLCAELSAGDISLATAGRGAVAVRAALAMRGVPYSWGGGGPNGPSYGIGRGAGTKGFDCSGLAEYAWAKAGVRVGGDTSMQWNSGTRVPRSQIRPGDLIFFAYNLKNPATIHHVGIAIDATRMVHAPSTGSTVRIEGWAGVPYREREFIGIVRP